MKYLLMITFSIFIGLVIFLNYGRVGYTKDVDVEVLSSYGDDIYYITTKIWEDEPFNMTQLVYSNSGIVRTTNIDSTLNITYLELDTTIMLLEDLKEYKLNK
jgi:hypothetical protein